MHYTNIIIYITHNTIFIYYKHIARIMNLIRGRGLLLPWFVNALLLSSLFIMSHRHSRQSRKKDSTVTLTPLQSPPLHSISDIVSNVFGDVLTKETRDEPTDRDTAIAIPGELDVQEDVRTIVLVNISSNTA